MPGQVGFLRDYPAPYPPYNASLCLSVPAMMPVILGGLETRAYSFCYTSDSAYGAVQAIREMQVSVINGLTRLDDIYRLLDTVHNGTVYVEGGSPGEVLPAIPAVPRTDFDATTESTRKVLVDIRTLITDGQLDTDEIEGLLNLLLVAIG